MTSPRLLFGIVALLLCLVAASAMAQHQDPQAMLSSAINHLTTQLLPEFSDKLLSLNDKRSTEEYVNECTLEVMQNMTLALDTIMELMNNVPADGDFTSNFVGILSTLGNIPGEKCFNLAAEILKGTVTGEKTVVIETDKCLQYDPMDPCCNSQLLAISCCAKRSVTLNQTEFGGPSSFANQTCGQPERTLAEMIKMTKIEQNMMTCVAGATSLLQDVSMRMESFSKSLVTTIEPVQCTSDADCPDSICLSNIGACESVGFDFSGFSTLAKKMIKTFDRASLLKFTQLPETATLVQIGQAVRERLTSYVCMDGLQPTSEEMTQEECESEKVCSDSSLNTGDCTGNAFCGAYCTGQCLYNLGRNVTKEACENQVLCASPMFSLIPTVAQCYSSSKYECSMECDELGNKDCNQTVCESMYACVPVDSDLDVFVDSFGSCLYPLESIEDSLECNSGRTKVGNLGCLDLSVTETKCKQDGAIFIDSGSAGSCPSFSVCERVVASKTMYSLLSKQSCEDCGGKVINPVKKVTGKLVPSAKAFIGLTKYTEVKVVSKRRWGRFLNEAKIKNFFMSFLSGQMLMAMRQVMSCSITPLLRSLDIISCACAKDRDPEAQCFGRLYPAAKLQVIADALKDQTFAINSAVSITIPKGALSGAVDLVVYFKELEQTQPTSARRIAADTATVYVQDASGDRIGQVLSSGYSVNPAIPNLKICLSPDSSIAPVNTSEYTKLTLVTESNSKYVEASVTTSVEGDSVCGIISDTNIYYAARVTSNSVEESGAHVNNFSVLVVFICFIISMLF